jgi:hypothetical protein
MYTYAYLHAPRTIPSVDKGKRKVDNDTLLASHARRHNKKSRRSRLALLLTLTRPLASPMLPLRLLTFPQSAEQRTRNASSGATMP